MRFEGTETYIATEDLKIAVNAAMALERPLLVKGEPGTGKTLLAQEIAAALAQAAASPGTSNRPPRRSRASTNTTRCRACATRSSAIRACQDIRNYIVKRQAVGGLRLRRARRCC